MKPHFEKITYDAESSLRILKVTHPFFSAPWHFHPEIELVWITRGYGKRFVGTYVEEFVENDLVLIGNNIPHMWMSHTDFYQNNPNLISSAYVLGFDKKLFSPEYLCLPEMKYIRQLLQKSVRGIKFSDISVKKVRSIFEKLNNSKGIERIIYLHKILDTLGKSKDIRFLTPQDYDIIISDEPQRIDKVCKYIMENYQNKITLDTLSGIVFMNKSALSRYFKKTTGKQLMNFINEIRIGFACKLLLERHLNISQIAFDCGFENLSNFNKLFKRFMNSTPTEYRDLYAHLG